MGFGHRGRACAHRLSFLFLTFPATVKSAHKHFDLRITDRMSAILKPEDWETWRGETDALWADVKAVLRSL